MGHVSVVIQFYFELSSEVIQFIGSTVLIFSLIVEKLKSELENKI